MRNPISILALSIFLIGTNVSARTIHAKKHETTRVVKKTTHRRKSTAQVYICTGEYSKKYHSFPSCRGLNRCSGSIKRINKSSAEAIGRTPCSICY